ncbi:hypothetical protein D3C87_34320 [compost metagenome]
MLTRLYEWLCGVWNRFAREIHHMKKTTLNLFFLLFVTSCFAQSPGGVGAPTLWLRGTAGTSTIVNAAANTTWTSGGSITANVTQATNANRPLFRDGSGTPTPYTTSLNVFNYNPYLFFDGTNDNLSSTTSYNFGSSSSSGTGITQFAVVHPHNTAGIVYFEWNGPNAMIKSKSDGPQCLTNGSGSSGTNNQYNMVNNTSPKIQHLIGFDNGLLINSAGPTGFSGYNHIAATGLASNNNPSGGSADRTNLGSNVNAGEFSRTDIAELIIFNRNLSLAEMVKVNTFLGLKYGITLGGNGSATDYVSSSSTTIWNAQAAYHNSVIGIGRDDGSGLTQKQSHTDDDTSRIYAGALLANTNGTSTGLFLSNNSFIVMGNNTGRLCATDASLAEMPTGLTACVPYSRLEREWRVQRTNNSNNFNWNLKLSSCAAPGSVNVADLRLLVDDDGDFSNGGTTCYYNGDGTGLVITYANPMITVTGISTAHIPNDASRFITIASVNLLTPLPVEMINYQAVYNEKRGQVSLNWSTSSEYNSDYFTLEVSGNMTDWKFLDKVPAAGSSQQQLDYEILDQEPAKGVSYYRLKQFDLDGSKKYEGIRSVNVDQSEDLLVYPNPTNGIVTVSLLHKTDAQLKVLDNLGRLVTVPVVTGDFKLFTLDFSQLAQGMYTVQLITDNQTKSVRLNYIR